MNHIKCMKHSYPETPHYVSGTFRSKDDSFLVISQPPTIVELVNQDDNGKKSYIVITNNYDNRLYPMT